MKKSIVDPLSSFRQYDLPTSPGLAERTDLPAVPSSITPLGDPDRTEVVTKLVLPKLLTIRHKKMKKHKRQKLRKRLRFMMRRRRQKKATKKERELQEYERGQIKLGEAYSAEHYVDEQLSLARKSGWHVDVIAEFQRERSASGDGGDKK